MAPPGPLASALLAHGSSGLRATLPELEVLEADLDTRLTAARDAWPDIDLDGSTFVGYVAARLEDYAQLDTLHCNDLYLACGCARGLRIALQAFEQHILAKTDPVLRRMDRSGGDLSDEIKQVLREDLLVGTAGRSPKILDYSGIGSLAAWTKVTASRRALMVLRKHKREVPLEDWTVGEAVVDGEMAQLKNMYQREFRAAFESGFAALAPEERNLLRLHIMDELSIDAIASLHSIHRATAARRLASARDRLADETKNALRATVGAEGGDLDSILRLVRSRLDLSMRRILEKDED